MKLAVGAGIARDRLLLALVAAHLLLKAALWQSVVRSPLTGDERAYRDGGLALRNLVYDLAALNGPNVAELKANVFANGWFMPGVSALLTPLYVAFPDAGVMAVRNYLGVIGSALLIGVALWLRKRLGYAYACGLMVVPGLVPMWVVFSYTAWGDLLAGLLAVGLVITIHRLITALAGDGEVRVRDGVLLGALAVACLYLRSSALPLVAGTLVLLALAAVVLARGPALRRGVVTTLAAVAVFAALLAPWSLSASKVFDTRVTTTTTTPLSVAVTFGKVSDLCYGPCPPARGPNGRTMKWFDGVRYSRQVAAVTGRSEVDIQKEMAAYALRDVTPASYAQQVHQNLDRYLFRPSQFARRFFTEGGAAHRVVSATTNVMLVLVAATMALLMLDVRRLTLRERVLRMVLKLFMLANLLQPFVHPGHGRYWTMFAPLLGLAGVFLLTHLQRPAKEAARGSRRPATVLVATLDVVATAFLVLAVVALLVLG